MRRVVLLSTIVAAVFFESNPAVSAAGFSDPGGQASLSQAQIREDFDLAIAMVEAGLPDLFWNQTRHEWRQAKVRAILQLRNARDGRDLYRVLAPLLSRIGEGHMSLRLSEEMIAADRAGGLFFPVDVHISTEGLFVISGYGDAADLPRGTEIVAIDDKAPAEILEELMTIRFHDGDIATEVMRTASGRGYAAYRQRLSGNVLAFHLRLKATDGGRFARIVHAVPSSARPILEETTDAPLPTLQWVNETALVTVPTFSNRRLRAVDATFPAAIRAIFEEVVDRGAEDMVLDIRENGGGSEPNEAILFSHLSAAPLLRYASVEARGARVAVSDRSGRRYEKIIFDPEELAAQKPRFGGRLSRRNIPPEGLMSHWAPTAPAFNGRLVVLAGGGTFSGGAELASMLRHTERAVFVGEEVGGGDQGNTSGYLWEEALPNSGLELSVPLLQFRFPWRPARPRRGVLPDCDVPPDVLESGIRRDRAWRVAIAILEQGWAHPSQATCPEEAASSPRT